MTPKRKQSLLLLLAMVAGVGLAVGLLLVAFDEDVSLFKSPTDIAEGKARVDRTIRVGGLVEKGSVSRKSGQLRVSFTVTDQRNTVKVVYDGILPDLFREGQGVVAKGRLNQEGVFVASEVLAKHDENYMPPEVADALRASGKWEPGMPMPDAAFEHGNAADPKPVIPVNASPKVGGA